MRFRLLASSVVIGLLAAAGLNAWDSKIHTGILHASLMAIPAEDRIQERLGEEAGRLRQYVQMGDWVNTLVSQREVWDTGGQSLELGAVQFYANDYLMFPGMTHQVQHGVPDVKSTYRPFFLRALQALRTESPANAARWTGSLLHFVTDSGSPPHTIGVSGPDHTKMESWLDTSLIDLSGYHPGMLGDSDEAAVEGLLRRMDALIAFSAIRGRQLLPLVKVNDRPKMEPIALESAAETARVAADVIHTLLKLSAQQGAAGGGTVIAEVSAGAVAGMENLPAKMMVLNSAYSTLSEQGLPAFHAYRGTFVLRNLPAGNYSVAVERIGSRTFYGSVEVKRGATTRTSFALQADPDSGNLAPNPDLSLHWITKDAPDHWHYDAPRHQWLSDTIPVTGGHEYRAGCVSKDGSTPEVALQWMSHAWEAMKVPTEPLSAPARVPAPAGAMFVKFVVKGQQAPDGSVQRVYLVPRTD
ncbi:MAG TPA: hypothetical protein VGL72_30000 [Bryobacteraceae bacterium]